MSSRGGTIFNRTEQVLAFADDVVLMARSKDALVGLFKEMTREASLFGLEVNNINNNHVVCIDYETLFNYSILFNWRTVHFKLKLLKFNSNKYRSLTVIMYRISFERPCIKSITSTYIIFSVKVY
jgi:hypothetical protein